MVKYWWNIGRSIRIQVLYKIINLKNCRCLSVGFEEFFRIMSYRTTLDESVWSGYNALTYVIKEELIVLQIFTKTQLRVTIIVRPINDYVMIAKVTIFWNSFRKMSCIRVTVVYIFLLAALLIISSILPR